MLKKYNIVLITITSIRNLRTLAKMNKREFLQLPLLMQCKLQQMYLFFLLILLLFYFLIMTVKHKYFINFVVLQGKSQTAIVISFWFWGLLEYVELYYDWTLHNQLVLRCSQFSEFDSFFGRSLCAQSFPWKPWDKIPLKLNGYYNWVTEKVFSVIFVGKKK